MSTEQSPLKPEGAVFEIEQAVMFQHCDPAGIVFYPRYFEMINATVERWFGEALDWSFGKMHQQDGVAVPLASITTDFYAPSRLGELLRWRLTPKRLGATSLALEVGARCGDEARLLAQATIVHVDMERQRPIRWPDWFRQRLASIGGAT